MIYYFSFSLNICTITYLDHFSIQNIFCFATFGYCRRCLQIRIITLFWITSLRNRFNLTASAVLDSRSLFRTPGFYSSMASKPINICWIGTGPHPYRKIMYSIILQIIFTNIEIKIIKLISILLAQSFGFKLIFFIFISAENCLFCKVINNFWLLRVFHFREASLRSPDDFMIFFCCS